MACQSLDCQQSADICSLELGGVGGGAVTRRDTYGEGGKEGREGGRRGAVYNETFEKDPLNKGHLSVKDTWICQH